MNSIVRLLMLMCGKVKIVERMVDATWQRLWEPTRDRRSLAHWSHDIATVWSSIIFHGDPRSASMIDFMHAYKVIIPSITNHTDFLIGRESLIPSPRDAWPSHDQLPMWMIVHLVRSRLFATF